MDAARWTRLQELFHAAADLPPSERQTFLDSRCADDATLVGEVLAMLHEDAADTSILAKGIASAARDVFGVSGDRLPSVKFGPYRAVRFLGEGGMGVVYLARRDDLGSVAAIKILRDAWLSPSRKERFASEQRTLAQLDHPAIARLYDADVLDDGTPWFAMEFVDGLPLNRHCETHQRSVEERLRLFRRVCEAVMSAHQRLVIHRDLKPSNVLVMRDDTVKLLDFGIAKHLDSLDDPAAATRTAARLMTPAYAAPEQLTGRGLGVQTDVFALGVILYELVTGRLPLDPDARAEAAATGVEPRIAPPSAVADRRLLTKAEWDDLDVICLTAMRDDPARRYASVDALIRDIDHHFGGEPLEARPDTVTYRVRKFARRHRQGVIGIAVAAAAIIGITAVYAVRVTQARNDAVTEAARAQRIQRFTLNLFQGGDKAAGPAESLRVITMVDRGLDDARSLDADPAVQSEVFLTLGTIYQQLGQLPRADSLITLALEKRRSLFGDRNRDVAATLVALGLVRVDEAKFESAESLIREGLTIAQATSSESDANVLAATTALGRVLQERGVYDKAIPVLEEAVRLSQADRAPMADVGARMSALADAHYYAGHLDVADSINRNVLAMYRATYGPRHPLVGDILINLGASQFDRGNYAAAEKLDREALAITRGFYGERHYKTAADLTMLGRALAYENRFDEARAPLNEALAIREQVYGAVHPSVASTLNDIGNIALQNGHYDVAASAFTRMLAIYRAIYGTHHYLIGIATANLASVRMAQRRYPEAESLFRAAVAEYAATQGPEHMNTAIGRIKLGRVLLREGRYAAAQVETRAGYDILIKQANPGVSFLKAARTDLVAEYDSLRQPEAAARFKAELAGEASGSIASRAMPPGRK